MLYHGNHNKIINIRIKFDRTETTTEYEAIVWLFWKVYLYRNIESIKVTIEMMSNAISSQGIPKSRFHLVAMREFNEVDV